MWQSIGYVMCVRGTCYALAFVDGKLAQFPAHYSTMEHAIERWDPFQRAASRFHSLNAIGCTLRHVAS